MAKKADVKDNIKKAKPTKQKLIIAQGRAMGTPEIPFKILYTEVVPDRETAKVREKELKEEYKETDALSVSYFSL